MLGGSPGYEHSFLVRALGADPSFETVSALDNWTRLFGAGQARPHSDDGKTVTLSPALTDTDGFYFAMLRKSA